MKTMTRSEKKCGIGPKAVVALAVAALAVLAACQGGSMSQAEMQRKIDSVRALDNLDILRAQGIDLEERSPVEEFYDSLAIQTLPLQATADYVGGLPGFGDMPSEYARLFGISIGGHLKAKALPETLGTRLMLLAADGGQGEPTIWLCSLDMDYRLVDKLLLYAPAANADAFNRSDTRAFLITSGYTITIQQYDAEQGTVLQQSYAIDDGRRFFKAE